MSRLEAYSDDSRSLDCTTCECGRAKTKDSDACARCRHLDGENPTVAQLISILREYNGMSTSDLTTATRRWDTAVWRTLKTMLASGRIRRYWRENDSREGTGRNRYGGTQRYNLSNSGHWVYALNADWERQ